jgi:hypothetical protein
MNHDENDSIYPFLVSTKSFKHCHAMELIQESFLPQKEMLMLYKV